MLEKLRNSKIVPAPANLADEIALLERQSQEETEKNIQILVPGKRFCCKTSTDHIHGLCCQCF